MTPSLPRIKDSIIVFTALVISKPLIWLGLRLSVVIAVLDLGSLNREAPQLFDLRQLKTIGFARITVYNLHWAKHFVNLRTHY